MSHREPRLSRPTLLVLKVFADRPSDPIAGSDILGNTRLMSGTLYPMLMRLERAGWLDSEWEAVDPATVGRPRKRMYRLTAHGARMAKSALSELGIPVGRLAWAY